MAIVHVNGFGTIPVSGDYISLIDAPSGVSTWSRQPGRGVGGYSLRHTNNTNNASATYAGRITLPSGLVTTEFSIGIAINHRATVVPTSGSLFGFRMTSGVDTEMYLGTGAPNQYVSASNTSSWNVSVSTPTGIGWHWWNLVFRYSATVGFARLYRDGVLLAEQAPDTVPNSAYTLLNIYLGNNNGGVQADFADLIIRNDATIIPDSRVDTLFPESTSAAGWLGSDADSVNNHLLINENPTVSAANYVRAGTVNTLDTYQIQNGNSAISVHAVQVAARATKTDGGAKTMQVLANANAGTATDPGAGGTVYGVFEQNSGSAWNTTSVNAMTAGIKVIS